MTGIINNDFKLRSLGLDAMALALEEQENNPAVQAMSFGERLDILLCRQVAEEDQKKFDRIVKQGGLKYVAWPDEIKCSAERNLHKPVVDSLLTMGWINNHQNIIITGAAGTGKTWLAHAFATNAAMWGVSVQYKRASDLILEFESARGTGTLYNTYAKLRRKSVTILDDFGLMPLSPLSRQDLHHVIDDGYRMKSLIITSQLPLDKWHDYIADPTYADSIIDRLYYRSHKLELKGDSQRAIYDSIELDGGAHA